ncbi:hypothetical protein GBAR_LOCUS19643 [Geodia barretti]|uniref:Uncharacterized protein n=1 Tax=Geodia barretti TaxID=519541 RepID=A0AA35STC4_GEOBA|nr:hypothetical protein GBAR_LOCUS19643 [Geodia barretti]
MAGRLPALLRMAQRGDAAANPGGHRHPLFRALHPGLPGRAGLGGGGPAGGAQAVGGAGLLLARPQPA